MDFALYNGISPLCPICRHIFHSLVVWQKQKYTLDIRSHKNHNVHVLFEMDKELLRNLFLIKRLCRSPWSMCIANKEHSLKL